MKHTDMKGLARLQAVRGFVSQPSLQPLPAQWVPYQTSIEREDLSHIYRNQSTLAGPDFNVQQQSLTCLAAALNSTRKPTDTIVYNRCDIRPYIRCLRAESRPQSAAKHVV